jgi:16S rRNA (adenine1518-N6/adenine1519-N6)-dimethyltransferase
MVKPKKHLGQHFLKDLSIAQRIAEALQQHRGYGQLLEIGPGTGVLTQFLVKDERFALKLIEIDVESVVYLQQHYPAAAAGLEVQDFLALDLAEGFAPQLGIIGNFPYNISSQIFFKVLEHRHQVLEVVGMLQKEVAQRLAAKPGNKIYGILSVLLQAYYEVEYLFEVPPGVFIPPPKVDSAVIALRRNDVERLACNEKLFFQLVKQSFNQRRKTLRNALKAMGVPYWLQEDPLLAKRAEQLNVADFVYLAQAWEKPQTTITNP